MSENANVLARVLNRLRMGSTPPVRERVVVRTIESTNREPMKPGFIIGAYRTGSTLLRFILDSHQRIAVPPESNFLNGVAELWRNDWYRTGLKGVGVDDEALRQRLRVFAGNVFEDYALANGKARWFDKTPSYIDLLDFLSEIFGSECQYIMLYRHGLDVANSLVRMHGNDVNRGPARQFADLYPGSPRLTNTKYWAVQCEKMLAFEAAHPRQCFRIRYEDFANAPEQYLPELFSFLGEEWDPEVLNFAEKQHSFGLQDSKIMETMTFEPNIGGYKAWPDQEIAEAAKIAGGMLDRLGYSV